jgi:L-malate glycosyltransferase
VTITFLHIFSTFAVGGPQRRAVLLANSWGPAYRHIIVPLDGQRGAAEGLDGDLDVQFVDVQMRKGRLPSLANLAMLRRLLRRHAPMLLLTYNFGALEAGLANRLAPICPHLHFEDGFGPEEASGRQLAWRVWLRRPVLGGNSHVLVPSRTLERIARDVWRLPAERLTYIANGIDCARYEKPWSEPRTARYRRPGEIVIGTVGVLRPEKNLERLLAVFARLLPRHPELRLLIVGDGPERAKLEARAGDLGVARQTTFAGFVALPETALAEIDIFALSSDTEQMPISVIEAMAAGLPIVSTKVGDVPEMLPDAQLAYVVARGDDHGFEERLSALLTQASARDALGLGNQRHARTHFQLTSMVERYNRLITELTAGSAAHRQSWPAIHGSV